MEQSWSVPIMQIDKQKPVKEQPIVLLGGKPIDFFLLKEYMLNVSPYQIKTAMRNDMNIGIEEMRRYTPQATLKFNWKTIIIILAIVGILIFALIMIFYGPAIIEKMQGMFGGLVGG